MDDSVMETQVTMMMRERVYSLNREIIDLKIAFINATNDEERRERATSRE